VKKLWFPCLLTCVAYNFGMIWLGRGSGFNFVGLVFCAVGLVGLTNAGRRS
jgi:hypothetical protein